MSNLFHRDCCCSRRKACCEAVSHSETSEQPVVAVKVSAPDSKRKYKINPLSVYPFVGVGGVYSIIRYLQNRNA